MADENADAVEECCLLLGLSTAADKQLIATALKTHKNDPNAVTNEWFESGEDSFRQKYQWDESAWAANRDGSLPSFNVQGPDETATNGLNEVWATGSPGLSAPSRPPSRAQSRSPLGAPQTEAQYEDDLQRAIAESKAASAGPTPQESGVTDAIDSTPRFGPATRDNYENDQWSMVRIQPQPTDPLPSARKRMSEAPVFLACRQNSTQLRRHRLGPLMMLLHEIPATRNFFLLLEGSSQSYGNNNQWWRGEAIRPNVDTLSEGWAANDVHLVDELKRLVAFLDSTDRSYGTADGLRLTTSLKEVGWDPIVRFYESLFNSSNAQEIPRMWTNVKIESSELGSRPQEFAILEFRVPNDIPDFLRNLYGQWDWIFWLNHESALSKCPDEDVDQIASIQVSSQVLTIRVTTEGPQIEMPEALYIDRYLEANLEMARAMQRKTLRMWRAIELANERENAITKWQDPQNWQFHDKRDMSQNVIKQSEDQIWQIRANALWRMCEKSADTDEYIPYLPNELYEIAELNEEESKAVKHFEAEIELARLRLREIDHKLARIKSEKEACYALLKELNQTLTVPSGDPKLNPKHKYTLRGVIPSPDVLYMCRRNQLQASEQADKEIDEWWRIAWVPDADTPVQQERTTIEKVKETMFTEVDTDNTVNPIFVYATDEALDEAPLHLSGALQTFVKFDNRLFKQELLEEPTPQQKKRGPTLRSPQSPPKRQRSDSMDSNRASMGDISDVDDRVALLSDQIDPFRGDDLMETEMTDMRPISHDEIAAHMVPPLTPPLSADEESDQDSPGLHRSSEKLANISLTDEKLHMRQAQDDKAPEMQELKTPFIVRRPDSGLNKRVSIMERPMEIDTNLEIPAVNPEDYYNRAS